MNKLTYIPLFLILIINCSIAQTDTAITNHIYDPLIRTVQVYLNTDSYSDQLNPPTRYISQSTPLVLEFDELYDDYSDFSVKILHCNADWKQSSLMDIYYLEDFNEFYIRKMTPGFNTKIQYTHYYFEVPNVKLSGNYILMVYRGEDEEDIVFTRRYMVYEELVNITPLLSQTQSGGLDEQQINFTVNYEGTDLYNPAEQVKVVIRQNNRWDNAKFDVKPTFINEVKQELDFIRLGTDNRFDGGNEFRVFDARSIRTTGQNVFKISDLDSMFFLKLRPDEPKTADGYLTYNDINGSYMIEQYEYDDPLQSDYVLVNFILEMPRVLGKIYVYGELTNWQMNETNKMYYNDKYNRYEAIIQLKQGYYNYKYIAVKNDGSLYEHLIEGNHYDTENMYEILFYYNPPGQVYDLLLGQAVFHVNAKN